MLRKLYFFILSLLLCFGLMYCQTQKYGKAFSGYKVYRNLKKAEKHKENVKILDLSNRKLKSIPPEVFEFSNLEVLNLYDNNLTFLPEDIENLKSLRRLNLMKNNLKDLPTVLTKLKNLERLDIAYNSISEKDVEYLEEALPNCKIIVDIIL